MKEKTVIKMIREKKQWGEMREKRKKLKEKVGEKITMGINERERGAKTKRDKQT